jgi:hypothetical protein
MSGEMSLVIEVLNFPFACDNGSQNPVHGALGGSAILFTAPLSQNKHLTLPFIKQLGQNNLITV